MRRRAQHLRRRCPSRPSNLLPWTGPFAQSMAALDDQVAGAAIGASVRDFYERHPYPLPVRDLTGYGRDLERSAPARRSHLFWPDAAVSRRSEDPGRRMRHVASGEICAALAAGTCDGNRLQQVQHRRNREAEAQAQHSQSRSAVNCRSSRPASLGRSFDLVVCTGVLHHLADPVAGLRALRDVLSPEGAMHLMVYAPYGRTGIYMLQEYCRRLGIGTSRTSSAIWPQASARCRRIIRCMPLLAQRAGLSE